MPRGIYQRKKLPLVRRKAAPAQVFEESTPLYSDRSRLDLLESLPDFHVYKPRYNGESVVVNSGLSYGLGNTVREALDNLASKG